jgi:hypothetical protein
MTKNKWIIFALATMLITISVIMLDINPAARIGLPFTDQQSAAAMPDDEPEITTGRLQLAFSHTEHFYDSDIEVAIIASLPNAVIHYTTDGSEPTSESPVYTEPLLFNATFRGMGVSIVPLKAIAIHGDTSTRPLVHTYFLGSGVHNRFDLLVFSLTTNDEYLYDYDTGIFVEGATRTAFIQDNPRKNIVPPDPANFNWRGMEGERPVHVEVFKKDGTRVISQAAGIRVHGGWSRAASHKSIRLIARREYEPDNGRFRFDFFPDDVIRDGYGTPLRRYDQLILRNGANDRDFGMLRNEVGSELARMAGVSMVTPVTGTVIFLNGEYYGFSWLQVRVNQQYLQDIFSAPTRDFQIVGTGERWIDTEDEDEYEAVEYFNSFIYKDLTNDRVFAEFKDIVDIDEFLLYYALQMYLGNHDWPNNNIKRWRYIGPQEEGLAPELDGRWRYITYDLDWILGLYEDNPNPNRPSFQEMMNKQNDRYSGLLETVLKRSDMADKFAMILCDITANIVTVENVGELIDRLYGEANKEIGISLASNIYSGWVSKDSVAHNHANMLRVATDRGTYITNTLMDFFNWSDDMFTVEVTGGEAIIGTQKGTSSTYFAHLTIPVRPALQEFTAFDHWIVNGERIYTPELTVSVNDAYSGRVTLELVTREEFPLLIFSQAYGSSQRNGCALFNPGNEIVNTEGLYLTNDLSNPFLWQLPPTAISPGGTLELVGRSGADATDLLKLRMNFNVREGRMLYLSDEDGNVIDTIFVK